MRDINRKQIWHRKDFCLSTTVIYGEACFSTRNVYSFFFLFNLSWFRPGGAYKDGAERAGVREASFYRGAQYGVPDEG